MTGYGSTLRALLYSQLASACAQLPERARAGGRGRRAIATAWHCHSSQAEPAQPLPLALVPAVSLSEVRAARAQHVCMRVHCLAPVVVPVSGSAGMPVLAPVVPAVPVAMATCQWSRGLTLVAPWEGYCSSVRHCSSEGRVFKERRGQDRRCSLCWQL